MAREILNSRHPTPNPDGPHAGSPSQGTGFGADRPSQPEAESATDEPNYDSCPDDDLDTILSQPISEPDPALRSRGSTETRLHAPRVDAEAVPFCFCKNQQSSPGRPRSSRDWGLKLVA